MSDSHADVSEPVVGTCSARAALAGNPSDGYGGAVVSLPLAALRATVSVRPAQRFELHHSPTDDDTFASIEELADRVDRFGYGDARQLVAATIRSIHRHLDARVSPLSVRVESTIPRSVGLAGSSAIVIATMRALAASAGDESWSRRLRDDPALQAAIALDAETSELGIAAGLQDRVVQCFEQPVLMDFATMRSLGIAHLEAGVYRPLTQPPGTVFVAALPTSAAPSGTAHRSLRDDFDDDRGATRRLMSEIAAQGHAAAVAIDRQDVDALGAAMDTTLDARRALMVLDPRHLAMAEIARSHGAHANFSGSGGAITVLAPNAAVGAVVREALRVELGCETYAATG